MERKKKGEKQEWRGIGIKIKRNGEEDEWIGR